MTLKTILIPPEQPLPIMGDTVAIEETNGTVNTYEVIYIKDEPHCLPSGETIVHFDGKRLRSPTITSTPPPEHELVSPV